MRTVHELTRSELMELRSNWYHQHLNDGTLEEVMRVEEGTFIGEGNIPMDVIRDYYEGTLFVEEDFFCNL